MNLDTIQTSILRCRVSRPGQASLVFFQVGSEVFDDYKFISELKKDLLISRYLGSCLLLNQRVKLETWVKIML